MSGRMLGRNTRINQGKQRVRYNKRREERQVNREVRDELRGR